MAGDKVRTIVGPTAAGKSAVAMWLADRRRVLIISADSRQVYRRFDVGTAKPSAAERARVPHRGIDVVEPTKRYSAFAWAAAAAGWIADAAAEAREPLVVGGTGLYVRALYGPSFDEPALSPARRADLERFLAPFSVDELRRWCAVLDPERAHLGRTQLLRAVEVALLTGRRLSELHGERARAPRFVARYLVVDPGPVLHAQIERRVDGMLARGWEEEVRALAARVPRDAPAWNATGYRAVREVVDGMLDRRRARERVIVETRQYAKRQRTWFRHQLAGADVTRLDPRDEGSEPASDAWWRGGTSA